MADNNRGEMGGVAMLMVIGFMVFSVTLVTSSLHLASALSNHTGDRVSFADLEPIYGTTDLRFSWSSQCWRWPTDEGAGEG